jgi:hypothetical protein
MSMEARSERCRASAELTANHATKLNRYASLLERSNNMSILTRVFLIAVCVFAVAAMDAS